VFFQCVPRIVSFNWQLLKIAFYTNMYIVLAHLNFYYIVDSLDVCSLIFSGFLRASFTESVFLFRFIFFVVVS